MVLRKCTGCGEIKDRSDLVRLMKDHKTHEILINPDSRHFGYSLYLCYNNECLKNALKKKRIQRKIKQNISENILEELSAIINKT